jgi:AraC-like DNA-binding protein
MATLLIMGCTGKGSRSLSDVPETMVCTHGDSIALAARFTGDFNHFLAVTDSLADAGELSQIRADGYRGVAYFQLGQIDKCIEYLRSAIADENPPAADFWEYIHAGANLVIILNSQRNYDSAMRITLRLINLLKQVDNPLSASELQTLYLCLGDTKMMLERRDEAVESYNEAYQWVLRTPNNATCRPLAASIETVENIAASHINHQMEAGIWVDRMDSLLAVYEAQPKAIDKEIKTFRALVLLHRAQVCQMQGKEAEAARNYEQYKSTDYGSSLEGRINGCDYLVEAHRYAEAADNYTQLDRFIKEWGYEYDLETIGNNLLPKLRSNYHAGRQDSALHVAMQIAEVYDSALVQQKQRDAAEMATIYDVQGKERQIVEQRAGKRLFTAISIAVAILALLILAFAVYVFRQWRATKEKNRILANQIAEAVEYREKLREQKKIQAAADSTAGAGLIISDFTTLTDEQLFLCLRDLIENERLFLQPDFGRQTLIDRTGLSKDCIGAAFAQGSDNNSLPAYVRELRLDYAIRLMNDQPDIAVEQVSQASGFTSADTFTRNFRAKYGMTPTAYKQTKISE